MPIVLSNDGRRWAASILTLNARGLLLGLFVNDFVPTPDNVLLDFTLATFSDYSPFAFDAWGAVFLNDQGDAESDYPAVIFRVGPGGGSDTVYGYLVYDNAGFVLWSEVNPAGGVLMNQPGDVYPVNPRFSAGALC